MLEFFQTHIAPTSPVRAKLVVYLIAQGVSDKSKDAPVTDVEVEKVPTNNTTPFIIEDVRDYKARLVASAGARPARELSEFEDTDAKL
jgi:insulysin